MKLYCPSSCLVCWKTFGWWEQIIVKVPENAGFHLDCAGKYPDDKVYTGIDKWITTPFYPNTTFISPIWEGFLIISQKAFFV